MAELMADMIVHTVTVGEDLEQTYVFADFADAERFREVAQRNGRTVIYDEQIVIDRAFAQEIILGEMEEGS